MVREVVLVLTVRGLEPLRVTPEGSLREEELEATDFVGTGRGMVDAVLVAVGRGATLGLPDEIDL